MKYYEYKFQCKKLPTKHTLHSLVTHFFGKDRLNDINYKVYQEGRLITILSNTFVQDEFSIDFFNKKGKQFNCSLYEVVEKETLEYKKGSEHMLYGTIEYGVNVTGVKGKKCPIHLGRFESNKLKDVFKSNIEKQLGVKVASMKNTHFNRMPSEILENHVQFNNVINIALPVIIEDPLVFSKIEFNSYFQKKSYGFGNIIIS